VQHNGERSHDPAIRGILAHGPVTALVATGCMARRRWRMQQASTLIDRHSDPLGGAAGRLWRDVTRMVVCHG